MKIFLKSGNNKNCVDALEEIKNIISRYNHTVTVSDNDSEKDETLVADCDLIITVGGDGTIIRFGKLAARHNIPVLGINAGRLGFLANVESFELELLEKLKAYSVEMKETVEAKAAKLDELGYKEYMKQM